jgi:hypothetical protein
MSRTDLLRVNRRSITSAPTGAVAAFYRRNKIFRNKRQITRQDEEKIFAMQETTGMLN